jgi:hypothetical protein
MNSIKIELDIGGRKFELAYEAPDAAGEISPTDLRPEWLDERLRAALRTVVGRTVLRYRREVSEPESTTLKLKRA